MFFAAIEGIPKVVELIVGVPEPKRSIALAAAQQSYQETAQKLGRRPCRRERAAKSLRLRR